MSDADRMRFETDELYVKSPEEMIEYLKAFPDAIENTVKDCRTSVMWNLNSGIRYCRIMMYHQSIPTHYDFFKELCDEGIKKRYGENPTKEILERAEYEIGVIKKDGLCGLFPNRVGFYSLCKNTSYTSRTSVVGQEQVQLLHMRWKLQILTQCNMDYYLRDF